MSNNNSKEVSKHRSFFTYASVTVNHPLFTNSIIALIIINAIIVGLETYPAIYGLYADWFGVADKVLLWIFTIEIALRLLATRPTHHFFKNSWNLFDFSIIVISHLLAGAHFITILRILRLLRVLRAISVIPSLRRLVNALLLTIPSLGNIILLMSIIFYIFGVLGTFLFAKTAPEYFGSLHLSLLTLFQLVTLDSWSSGVMRPIFAELPWSWLYFVSFILVGTFVIFNLFIGVIVNNVEKAEKEENNDQEEWYSTKQELTLLRQEINELKTLIQKRQDK